jgi:hypothetical protein
MISHVRTGFVTLRGASSQGLGEIDPVVHAAAHDCTEHHLKTHLHDWAMKRKRQIPEVAGSQSFRQSQSVTQIMPDRDAGFPDQARTPPPCCRQDPTTSPAKAN